MDWILNIDPNTALFVLLWLLPGVGTMSLTQLWKIDQRDRTGIKPSNARSALVATCLGFVLYALVHALAGESSVPRAIAIGLAAGPAVPLIWLLVSRCASDRIARAMSGGRSKCREPGTWTAEERSRRIHDTLYGDDDPTLREQIRKAREQHERDRRWKGRGDE